MVIATLFVFLATVIARHEFLIIVHLDGFRLLICRIFEYSLGSRPTTLGYEVSSLHFLGLLTIGQSPHGQGLTGLEAGRK